MFLNQSQCNQRKKKLYLSSRKVQDDCYCKTILRFNFATMKFTISFAGKPQDGRCFNICFSFFLLSKPRVRYGGKNTLFVVEHSDIDKKRGIKWQFGDMTTTKSWARQKKGDKNLWNWLCFLSFIHHLRETGNFFFDNSTWLNF